MFVLGTAKYEGGGEKTFPAPEQPERALRQLPAQVGLRS